MNEILGSGDKSNALVVQRTGREIADLVIEVRFLSGAQIFGESEFSSYAK